MYTKKVLQNQRSEDCDSSDQTEISNERNELQANSTETLDKDLAMTWTTIDFQRRSKLQIQLYKSHHETAEHQNDLIFLLL